MKMQKLSWVMLTGLLACLSIASLAHAQRLVVVNGEHWSPAQIAASSNNAALCSMASIASKAIFGGMFTIRSMRAG